MKKVDYVKVRGILAIIGGVIILIYTKMYKLETVDDSVQGYLIVMVVVGLLFSLYFSLAYVLRFFKATPQNKDKRPF